MGQLTAVSRRVAPVIAAAFVVLTACSDSSVVRGGAEVRDSVGIRIVENMAPASSTAWSVDLQPDASIGGNEADSTQLLFRVAGSVTLGNGSIVIAHGPAPMVRWYDGSGTYQFGTGRIGGGPGEFGGGISTIWPLAGDSVATWEHAARRMQVFSPEGEFVRAVVLELPRNMPTGAYPQVVGRLNGGFVAFLNQQRELGPVGEVVREPRAYVWYESDGTYVSEIGSFPGFTSYTREYQTPDGRQAKTSARPPFAKSPAAWSSEGMFYYGSADRYEIGVYNSTGSLLMFVRKPVANQAVTTELIEREKSRLMAEAPADPSIRRQWQDILNTAPYPDSFPAYRRIRVDRVGMLWVQDYDLPGADSVTWSVFDREGRWVSEVTIPERWQVLDIGADYILILAQDELDIEHVQRHALFRG